MTGIGLGSPSTTRPTGQRSSNQCAFKDVLWDCQLDRNLHLGLLLMSARTGDSVCCIALRREGVVYDIGI